MPHISGNKLSKETEEELIKNLNMVLTTIHNDSDMILFLESLLTPTEKLMLAKRLAMVVMIEEGLDDTHIASSLHITRITTAKMRYYYEARGEGFKIALHKIRDQKNFQLFKEMLLSLARYSTRAAGGYVKLNPFE